VLAGIFHETHSFLDRPTTLAEFECEVGDEMLVHRGDASPLAGALEVADRCGWQLLPAADLRATPSGLCDDGVLETFWQHLRRCIAANTQQQPVDGIYLVLHGAMCSKSYPDTEEEIVSRLRSLVGDDVPICGVLDMHGNISERTVCDTDGLVAYRCNPHTDAKAAAAQGAELLDRIVRTRRRPRSVHRHIPVVWPPTGVGTADDPLSTLEGMARTLEQRYPETMAHCSVMGGFAYADCPATGVSFHFTTFGGDAEVAAAEAALEQMCGWAMAHRQLGNVVSVVMVPHAASCSFDSFARDHL
jgi:microcystin degradation protein MlrC